MNTRILLVRHGESVTNVGAVPHGSIPDYTVRLTPNGLAQARTVGERLKSFVSDSMLFYRSPYERARQTFNGILEGAGVEPNSVKVYEDPRLREVDHGYDDIVSQQEARRIQGWFYYRFKGGESPADCFDRVSGFVDSLMRQIARKRHSTGCGDKHCVGVSNALVVTHGLTIRCLVTRFFHMSVEEFERLANPKNCDVIEIATKDVAGRIVDEPSQFSCGRWELRGIRYREDP